MSVPGGSGIRLPGSMPTVSAPPVLMPLSPAPPYSDRDQEEPWEGAPHMAESRRSSCWEGLSKASIQIQCNTCLHGSARSCKRSRRRRALAGSETLVLIDISAHSLPSKNSTSPAFISFATDNSRASEGCGGAGCPTHAGRLDQQSL